MIKKSFFLFMIFYSFQVFARGASEGIPIYEKLETFLFTGAEKVNYEPGMFPLLDPLFKEITAYYYKNNKLVGFEFFDDYDVYFGYGTIRRNSSGNIEIINLYCPMFYLDKKDKESFYPSQRVFVHNFDENNVIVSLYYKKELYVFKEGSVSASHRIE